MIEYLEERRKGQTNAYVFLGQGEDNAFGSFPNHWKQIFKDSLLPGVTPHVFHSFASIGNDLGFTEATIAELVGHSSGSVTSKYIDTLDGTRHGRRCDLGLHPGASRRQGVQEDRLCG